MKGHRYYEIDTQHSQEAAYRAIAEGIVLLKNQEQVLPLKIDASVNMVGEGVHTLLECGGGSAEVLRKRSESLYECMRAKAGVSAIENWEEIETSDADYVVLVGKSRGQEGVDRAAMLLDQEDQEFVVHTLKKAKEEGKKTILILNIAGPVDMREYEAYADAVLCVFIPGCQGNRALADVIYGDVNPSGKLAITFPKNMRTARLLAIFRAIMPRYGMGRGFMWDIVITILSSWSLRIRLATDYPIPGFPYMT
ncbi:glycoside hydrolase family 3 C-terminal domain-containing protein [Blautia sp. RD014234]|nr:glycoside hydrolase family 3 C-terminal domain-containing protein [Blautia parvula]